MNRLLSTPIPSSEVDLFDVQWITAQQAVIGIEQ
jgi:hypothetical protein